MGEPRLRRDRSKPAVPWLVRPGRLAAVNDNRRARRQPSQRRRLVHLLLLGAALAAVLAVGACGRRGAPQLPPSAASEPRAPLYATEPQGETVPDRNFALDPMLQ